MRSRRFRCPLYRVEFLAIRCPEKALGAAVRRAFPQLAPEALADLTSHAAQSFGLCLYEPPAVIIWIDSRLRFRQDRMLTAVHEALHATEQVLGRAGLQMTTESVEAFTYYQGWVLREMWGVV